MSRSKKGLSRYIPPVGSEFKKEEFPFYWLSRVNARYSLALEQALKKIGMDIPRSRILHTLLEDDECSVSEISGHSIAKLSTIVKTVHRMKADGLVDTRQSEVDGRVTLVSLTDFGRVTVDKVQLATAHIFDNSFRGMTDVQLVKLNDLLEQIFRNLPEG